MKTIAIVFFAAFLIGGTQYVLNRAPDAAITIEGMSPQELEDLGWTSATSSGLDVVGVGELVYMSGAEASGEGVTTFAWSVSGAPAGSAVVLDSTDAAWFTFRPDKAGEFTIDLNITTASGAASTSQRIVAAEYVGIGNMGGATPSFVEGQCASCHPGQAASYMQTDHASKLTREIDGLGSDFYNASCIKCHTVGFDDDPEAVNGGFDDVASDLGWTFPATLEVGNWQDMLDNFPQLAQLANIQCENCHGPGSLHRGDKTKIDYSLDEAVCGKCHEDAPYHVKNIQWKNSKHSEGVGFAAARPDCAGCHSGYGFVNRFDPASNLDEVVGNPQITCATCHDPHDATNEHQLRVVADVTLNNGDLVSFGGIGKLCMNCHQSRRDAATYVEGDVGQHFGPHGSPQADMLAGTNAITFGRVLPNSTHKDVVREVCITCHMQDTPAVGEPGHNEIGEHSFAIDANGVDGVAVCQGCHDSGIESFEDIMARKDYDGDGTIEGAIPELEGVLDQLGMLLPPLGDPLVDLDDADNRAFYTDKPLFKKVLYNYLFVFEDHSKGVHNYQFAMNLLLLSKDVATYGVLTEGMITEVADVPNDQGKQVQVSWTRFGGDGPSDDPIQVYYVWRKVDAAAAGKMTATYPSFAEVPGDATVLKAGASVLEGGDMWTQVGSQPAAMMDLYSAVVPTLYDSTSAGVQLSEFIVTGHTATSTTFATSAPATGYSIDNLVPVAPAGIVAKGTTFGIVLQWEEAQDADFDYFAIYRSTESGFDATGMDPLTTTTSTDYTDAAVDPTTVYYYRLAAFDFSGNQGAFSGDVEATMATAVESLGEVPTEYNLMQNYPNPFNPTTQIQFALPEAGDVRISIYDVAGKQIAVLVDEHRPAGTYSVSWSGENLASGVYLYKMTAGSFTRTRTMLLIK